MAKEELEIRVEQLEQDKKQLMNRCWALTNGLMCQFCGFEEDCEHSKTKAECEAKRKAKTQPKQISIEEWLAWLKNDNGGV